VGKNIFFKSDFGLILCLPIVSDVVETVTSETETWLKFRDRDFVIKAETETWKFETETSHFSDGN